MKRFWVRSYRSILALAAFTSVVWDMGNQILRSGVDPVNALSHFTMLSNLFGAGVLAWCAAASGKRTTARIDRYRGAAVVYLIVTGAVFAILMDGGAGAQHVNPWSNTVLHQLMPIALVVDWILVPPIVRIHWRQALWWLAFPVVYAAWILTRGPFVNWYPYKFIDPTGPDGYGPVSLNIVGMSVAVLVLIALVRWVGNGRAMDAYTRPPVAPMLLAAARNNASWCEAMCQAHGVTGELSEDAWVNLKKNVLFYPNLVTLCPTMSSSEVLTVLREASLEPLFVKDSFVEIDLAPGNYRILFEAEWIHRPGEVAAAAREPAWDGSDQQWRRVTDVDELRQWEQAWTGYETPHRIFPETLLLADDVIFLGGFSEDVLVAGAVLHLSHGVSGVSNVFGPSGETDSTWSGMISCARGEVPGTDLVGYERGTDLATAVAKGFTSLGPLRVWQQNTVGR